MLGRYKRVGTGFWIAYFFRNGTLIRGKDAEIRGKDAAMSRWDTVLFSGQPFIITAAGCPHNGEKVGR